MHILLGVTRRRVAETQRYRQLSAALHKFKVRSDAAALYLTLREAMPPAFSDVSSLNLAAFSAANFFCALTAAVQAQIYQATAILT